MGIKNLLRDETRSNAVSIALSVGMATVTGIGAAVLARLDGLSVSQILAVGLSSLAAVLLIVAAALYIKSKVPPRAAKGIAAVVGLLILYGAVSAVGNALQEIDRLRKSDQELQNVDREDPAHANFDQRLANLQSELNKERIERLAAQ
jgi:hypothetical protein